MAFMLNITVPVCGGAAVSQELRADAQSGAGNHIAGHQAVPIAGQDYFINSLPEKYSYDNFLADMEKLEKENGDKLQCVRLCDTADGRGVYDIILGNPHGSNQILIFGAMHAREYITAQLVMGQLCDAVDVLNGVSEETTYRDTEKRSLLDKVTIHFIPMNNPDGVSISQFGLAGIRDPELRQRVSEMPHRAYEQWKANARGVDLNRNFDADWQNYVGAPSPSSSRYKGAYPGSEPEASALIDLTSQYHIQRAISYHTCGALIYWYYKQQGDVLAKSHRFAQGISDETGYPLDDDYTAVDAAGYKDWAVYHMGVPAITIETGDEMDRSIINPVPMDRFADIWERNKNVVYATAYDLLY